MATSTDPLAALRAIHLPPPPPSSLPETLALAAAAGIACALLVLAVMGVRTRLARRRSPAGEALAALARSGCLPDGERLAVQAAALRRYIAATAGTEAARARSDAWLAQLDATFATDFFTAGDGQVYGDALYRPPGRVDPDATGAALGRLLRRARA